MVERTGTTEERRVSYRRPMHGTMDRGPCKSTAGGSSQSRRIGLGLLAACSAAPGATQYFRRRSARRPPYIRGTTINMVAWPGPGDKALIEPFERATGARIRVKEYAKTTR
jgi:spermidine/putrescine-binding protein